MAAVAIGDVVHFGGWAWAVVEINGPVATVRATNAARPMTRIVEVESLAPPQVDWDPVDDVDDE